jgi:hypothetical protein
VRGYSPQPASILLNAKTGGGLPKGGTPNGGTLRLQTSGADTNVSVMMGILLQYSLSQPTNSLMAALSVNSYAPRYCEVRCGKVVNSFTVRYNNAKHQPQGICRT